MDKLANKVNLLPQKDLESYLNSEDLSTLHNLKLYLDDLYYNTGDSTIEDYRYDLLKDTLKKRDPKYIPPVGAKIRTGDNRVKIPVWLGSADKITPKDPEELKRWIQRNPCDSYIITEKLDGVSCLYVAGKSSKLYTRGDGITGADITHVLPYLKLPPTPPSGGYTIRGELIISKEVFESKYRGKTVNGRSYRNPRNMVAGLIGGKTARVGLEDINFVVYELVGDSMPEPEKQLKQLSKAGFKVAKNILYNEKLTIKSLSNLFLKFKEESEYEIDGIVIQSNVPYDRNTSGNPEYLFAFKMLLDDAIHATTVKHIEWHISKWGQLKPVVILEPVLLKDITISKATAHNAKYVEENKLGPGAIIKVTRSNDVIPYITEIVKQANEPQMPDIPYVWDKTHVNITAIGDNDISCIKLISGFFAKLGIKHVSEATVSKMFANGLDNVLKIIGASKKRILQVPEFQEKSAERIYNNIHNNLKDVSIALLIGSSGVLGFGLGRKRLDSLFLDIPDLLEIYKKKTSKQMKEIIMKVEGFSDIMADRIVPNLKYADLFIQKLSKYTTFRKEERAGDSLKGHKYVMTGFRDKLLEEEIARRGGKITTAVSGNTTGLIVATKGEKITGKLKKANDLGVKIWGREEFKAKFIV